LSSETREFNPEVTRSIAFEKFHLNPELSTSEFICVPGR
jgi:hypothetical protein